MIIARFRSLACVALLGLTSFSSSIAWAGALECRHLPMLFQAYLQNHYSVKTMTDDLKAHTIERFIKDIDPSKTLLIQSDVEKLRKDLPAVFASMKQGDCASLDATFTLMIQRAEEDETVSKTTLGKEYKLDESVEFVLDPDKRGYMKSEDERKDLLKKMIHFQISNYLLANEKLPEAKKMLIHRYELVTKRLKERKEKGDAPTFFAEAFATALDPHSSFMSKETLDDFQIQMRLSLEGIGATLSSQDGFTVIEDLIAGGAADKLKILKPKDKIISVTDKKGKSVAVIDMDLKDVVGMIRGPKGTKVTLTILRQAEKTETFPVTIVRDKIDIKDQAAKMTYENRKVGDKNLKIGVIDLPSFYGSEKGERSAYQDVKTLLEEAKKEKADGLVLNLSHNGGGLLQDSVRISGLFMRKGGMVATKSTEKPVEVLTDDDEETQWNGPLVVLTSHLSASASEILAGALKDYRRAVIVGGDHTFGKGTVQVVQGLPANLGAMKVTIGMFFRPGGASTQHLGVKSDITVPSIYNNDDIGERSMDYSLPPQKTEPFLSTEANSQDPSKHWIPVDEPTIKVLTDRSKDRVAKDPKFIEVQKEIEEVAKNKGLVKLADIRNKAKKDEKKTKKAAGKVAKDQKMKDIEQPLIDEGVNVVIDLIGQQTQTLAHQQ
jgi:carboxyl-terminal processing protease